MRYAPMQKRLPDDYIIACASDKQKVTDQHYEAVTDTSPDIRNNAFHALIDLVVYAASPPTFQLEIKNRLICLDAKPVALVGQEQAFIQLDVNYRKKRRVFFTRNKSRCFACVDKNGKLEEQMPRGVSLCAVGPYYGFTGGRYFSILE